jgi:hypothetical protein
MAAELLVVAERRRPESSRLEPRTELLQFVREDGEVRPLSRPVPVHERPPAASVPAESVLAGREPAAGRPEPDGGG